MNSHLLFIWGEKMHPRHSSLYFLPPTNSTLSTCISSQRGGSQGGNYSVIQKWRGKKNPPFHRPSAALRLTQSARLLLAVRIWSTFSGTGGKKKIFYYGGDGAPPTGKHRHKLSKTFYFLAKLLLILSVSGCLSLYISPVIDWPLRLAPATPATLYN